MILISIMFLSSIAVKAQQAKEASITIDGEVKTSLVLTLSDIDQLENISLVAKNHNNIAHSYSGAVFADVLKMAGVTLGEELKGENLTKYILIEAIDGYQVLFSLPEIDPAFNDHKIILATRKDGVLLSSDEGPFRIVIKDEKRKSRSIRQVVSVKVKYAL